MFNVCLSVCTSLWVWLCLCLCNFTFIYTVIAIFIFIFTYIFMLIFIFRWITTHFICALAFFSFFWESKIWFESELLQENSSSDYGRHCSSLYLYYDMSSIKSRYWFALQFFFSQFLLILFSDHCLLSLRHHALMCGNL